MTHPRLVAGAIAALLFPLLIPRTALAQSAVVAISAADDHAQVARANAEAALRQAGLSVVDAASVQSRGVDLVGLSRCLASTSDCSSAVAETSATWVVALELVTTRDGDSGPEIVITAWLADQTGARRQVDRRFCEKCKSSSQIGGLVGDLVTMIMRAEDADSSSKTFVAVHSNPPNAELSIDGSLVGPTGRSYRVAPGSHVLVISKTGYEPVHETVQAVANQTRTVDVEMAEQSSSTGGRPLAAWLILGGGFGAMAAGGGLLLVDGPRSSSGQRLEDRYDTRTLGMATVAIGAAAAVTGIVWLLRVPDGSQPVTLSAAPTTSGFAVELGGSF